MRKNTDQKNTVYEHFSSSDSISVTTDGKVPCRNIKKRDINWKKVITEVEIC